MMSFAGQENLLEKMNMFQSINSALEIAMESDPSAGT